MKTTLLFATVLCLMMATAGKAQVYMPQPSTTQTIRQDFGMGKIEITYSRPNIRGRKLFGKGSELAPLGKLWRTGANAATKVRFTDGVMIAGKNVDSGTYVVYTVPNKGQWEIVLNKGLSNWGVDGYKGADDVVRTMAPAQKLKNSVETFTIQIGDVKPESCELQLMWGKTMVSLPVTTNITNRLRSQIETAMAGANKPYQQAATFYYEYEKNYPKALENVNKAIEANNKAFWLYLMKARIQKEMGDKTAARQSANTTITLATEAKNDDYVRMAQLLINQL